MARVSTYLNFMGNAEEAFDFYRTVFGTEYLGPIHRDLGHLPRPLWRAVDVQFCSLARG